MRVGIGEPNNWANPGKEVAWARLDPNTFQRLRVPAGSNLVALVVEADCAVHMEKPWTSTADDWDADPASRLFYILGGRAVDMSGWGVPISDRNPLPSDVVEVPLQRIDDPCPGMF